MERPGEKKKCGFSLGASEETFDPLLLTSLFNVHDKLMNFVSLLHFGLLLPLWPPLCTSSSLRLPLRHTHVVAAAVVVLESSLDADAKLGQK